MKVSMIYLQTNISFCKSKLLKNSRNEYRLCNSKEIYKQLKFKGYAQI